MISITPEQQLRNLSALVRQMTEPTRRNVRRPDHFAASKEEIAGAARQLAEEVDRYLNGELVAVDGVLAF